MQQRFRNKQFVLVCRVYVGQVATKGKLLYWGAKVRDKSILLRYPIKNFIVLMEEKLKPLVNSC